MHWASLPLKSPTRSALGAITLGRDPGDMLKPRHLRELCSRQPRSQDRLRH